MGEQLALAFEEFESDGEHYALKPKPNEVGCWPYPHPCPWRENCINYAHFLETGHSCAGEYAWCERGQLAAGRVMPEWRWKLMSPYERRYLKGVILGDPKALKALKRQERNLERMYEV